MTARFTQRVFSPRSPWFLAALLIAPFTFAAGSDDPAAAQAKVQRGPAQCAPLRADKRADCLSEARTLRARAPSSRAAETPEELVRNALRRCEPLPEADRQDCIARMSGQGTTTGSVAGGGIYRELVTREPASELAPAAAAR